MIAVVIIANLLCGKAIVLAGLTESCAASFIQVPNCISMQGTVGPPLPNIDVRLESVPELGYDALANPPRGEICIRGNTLFAGYYKREDLTHEVLVDGWFHTGEKSRPLKFPEPLDSVACLFASCKLKLLS
jgi:long-chain acyl-CoA synthetase